MHCILFLTGTLVPEGDGTLVVNSAASTLQSELGTMVINQDSEEEEEEEDDGTMKRKIGHDPARPCLRGWLRLNMSVNLILVVTF